LLLSLSFFSNEKKDKDSNNHELKQSLIYSKFLIVDLAGSERLSDKNSKRTMEGANINKSLLSLGNCINILSDSTKKGCFIPYRDSKLTRLLKDSLGGNIMTVMVACISPSYYQIDETLSTLKYSSRARKIKKKVSKNVKEVDIHITQYKDIIDSLKLEVENLKEIIRQQTTRLANETEKLIKKNINASMNNFKILEESLRDQNSIVNSNLNTTKDEFNNTVKINTQPKNNENEKEKEKNNNKKEEPLLVNIDLNLDIEEIENKIDILNKNKEILENKIENAVSLNILYNETNGFDKINNKNTNKSITEENKNITNSQMNINTNIQNDIQNDLDIQLATIKLTYERYLELINEKLVENIE